MKINEEPNKELEKLEMLRKIEILNWTKEWRNHLKKKKKKDWRNEWKVLKAKAKIDQKRVNVLVC